MRKFLQRLLSKRVIRLSNKFGSRPDAERVHSSLTELFNRISSDQQKKGLLLDVSDEDKIVILSDQHKGARDHADDFALAEGNYLAALEFYNSAGFTYINLGDSEELWENLLEPVIKHNKATFEHEKKFLDRNAFIKIFGNHDLYWDNDPLAAFNLNRIYGQNVKIYEGAILKFNVRSEPLTFFLTHGHQGDLQSDGSWFSKWFVSTIWAPLQSYLMINPNTPAYDDQLKSLHNRMMYEWSASRKNIILVTGHTHQPVFASLTHLEQIYRQLSIAKKANDNAATEKFEADLNKRIRKGDIPPEFTSYKPNYFNTGCCCFSDGDITGIEIAGGRISLVKWKYNSTNTPERSVLEEASLETLLEQRVEAMIDKTI